MYAIVDIAGQQFKVEKDQKYFVHQLDAKPGSKITFDNVLLLDDNGKVTVGAPSINGIQVTAKIEQHLLGDKVIIFKKKRRKGYAVKNGHRQRLTEITVQEIGKKSTTKKTTAKSDDKKDVVQKVAPKSGDKKVVAKKVASKKSAVQKAPAKAKKAASKAKKES
jgi:large subunit ribosomal protein L21